MTAASPGPSGRSGRVAGDVERRGGSERSCGGERLRPRYAEPSRRGGARELER